MHEQGYTVEYNTLYQGSQSTLLILKNGRNSWTGNSRHINIRYFFIKDRINNKEIKVEYFPSTNILGDYFMKVLQGQLFLKFRSVIM